MQNRVKIVLEINDTYSLIYKEKINIIDWTEGEKIKNIYCDQLVDVFEKTTGFFLHF